MSFPYDVSELTDEVRWFVIAQQMTKRNAIQSLRQAFFFDAVESDDVIKFRKRDLSIGSLGRAIITIPDDDLCAREYGQQSGDPLRTIRKKEQDLPRTVTLTYIDVDADYQIGAQSSPRQTTRSQQDVSVEVPIGLTSDEALQKCWTLLTSEWVERESFEFQTTRKWAYLEPTDVVYVRGRVIRLQTKTEQPNGVIKWGGVLASPSLYNPSQSSIYVQTAPGGGTGGFVAPVSPGAKVATRMILLDLPLINDTDFANGFYAAVAPVGPGSWTGAEVYESSDGGTTYYSVGSSTVADVIGSVSTATGNFTGGNNFDESTLITVVIGAGGGTLSSASETAVLNGANECIIGTTTNGWEVLQFKSASLIATDTYILSGLLRGRRGTEWMIPLHGAAETFIMMPPSININGPYGELGSSRKFKCISFGGTLASATAQDFTNNGVALKPYAPVALSGGRTQAGDLLLGWIPRTRVGGAWLEGIDSPLSDADSYEVQLYSDSSYTTTVYGNLFSGTTATITAAELFTAFGSPTPAIIYFDVAQLGAGPFGFGYAGRGQA